MATQTSASQVISETAKAEGGPTKGSDSAQMQSQVTKQRNAEQATEEVAQKFEDGTVTKEDANYVESRQHKALGHRPEAGSVAAQAQSVANQKENATPNTTQDGTQNGSQNGTQSGTQNAGTQTNGRNRDQRAAVQQAEAAVPQDLAEKIHSDPQHVSHADAAAIMSAEHKTLGFRPPKGTLASEAQHLADVNEPRNTTNNGSNNTTGRQQRIEQAEAAVPQNLADKVHNDPEHVTHADAAAIESAEHKALGFRPPKGSLAAQAQHLADVNDGASGTNGTNSTSGTNSASTNNTNVNSTNANGTNANGAAPDAVEQSHRDRELNFQAAAAEVKDKIEHDPGHVTGEDANHLHRMEERAHGRTEKGGITAQAQHLAAQNEGATNDSSNSSSNTVSTNNAANDTVPPLANAAQGIQEATAAAEAAQSNQS